MKPPFVFMGSPQFAATILAALVEGGWKPALVVTEPPKPVGRKQVLTPTAVQTYAESVGLPVATPATKEELFEVINDQILRLPGSSQGAQDDKTVRSALDLIVVAAYGKILPEAVLDLPTHGAVNVHASLLPKYRGASPIQAAILAGDEQTGITFMRMEPSLDTGPIISQHPVDIAPTDSTPSLTKRLADIASATIAPMLESYLANPTNLTEQDDAKATYAPKLTKEDGLVELSGIEPVELDRKVRALNPWPGVWTDKFADQLKILDGYLENGVYTITSLQWAGKQPVDGATLARAHPDILTVLPPTITLGANK